MKFRMEGIRAQRRHPWSKFTLLMSVSNLLDLQMLLRLVSLFLLIPGCLVFGDAPYKKIADLVYSNPNGSPQLLDLYLPQDAGRMALPVVVWVHGGGWMNGSKEKPRAEFLAGHGYAVASINYRLTGEAQWPAQIDDCRNAVRWLRENASEYRLNPDKIGVFGSSAGGHLVALMGTLPCPAGETVASRVQAVCDWFGPSDLLTMPPNNIGLGRTAEDVANSNGAKLLGHTVLEVPDLARQVSAFYNVSSDDPPFLIMHGDQDPGVPISQSTRLYHKLLEHGVYAELEVVEGAGHGGPLFNEPAVQARVLNFFDRFLK
ncbi:MAG: alpha/beta hydrolase [Verrucomicrobiae bacterium]|nr:alpha/beta hydrolase [Verrucomicrobiae bacterium]